jgi:methyl-accepting chemotaxis protein WspA
VGNQQLGFCLDAHMKPTTIWQRLNRALLLLLLLLLAGVGLAAWGTVASLRAYLNGRVVRGDRDRVYGDVMRMNDALRLSLDPKSTTAKDSEKKRYEEAKKDLTNTLSQIERFSAGLGTASTNLGRFLLTTGALADFQSRVRDMAEEDPATALAYFDANHHAMSLQCDLAFLEFDKYVSDFRTAETGRAWMIVILGVTGVAVIALASLLVGRLQSSTIAKPLNRLVASLERMRQGDFTERLAFDQKDELGSLSRGLNRLADDLGELVRQVQHSGIQVNATATEIAANAKEQQSTAQEIAATTAEIGATSKQISATSKELVKTMNEVNHVAEETAHVAGSGQAAIARMENTMRQIMDASGSITGKLAVLSEKTTNINSVVTTITKVADQTNLLSLNAAIEAEKAGEYGLGFAVVAMEIRRLADQTAVATYDIEKMVKEMQSAVAAGVMGMDKFSEEVRHGVEEVRQVSTHLAQIIHQVQTLTPRFQTVNEGMHAQATGAEQISETLTQLSEAAQRTAESLRQSNLAIEQLNGAARGLQTSVAGFKFANGREPPSMTGDGGG